MVSGLHICIYVVGSTVAFPGGVEIVKCVTTCGAAGMRSVGEWALTSRPFFLHSNVLSLFITCFNSRLHSFVSIPVFANAKQSVGFRIPFHFNFVILSFL